MDGCFGGLQAVTADCDVRMVTWRPGRLPWGPLWWDPGEDCAWWRAFFSRVSENGDPDEGWSCCSGDGSVGFGVVDGWALGLFV